MGLMDNKSRIFNELAEGRTREEIFSEFSEESPDQSGKIAYAIASIPSENLREKYLLFNHLLFSLLIGYALLVMTAAYPVEGSMEMFILILKICIPSFFSYYVYHFHGGLYKFLGLWCIIEMVEVVGKEPVYTLFSYSKMAVLGFILLVTILICLKVFPHFGFMSPRQDSEGNYRLG